MNKARTKHGEPLRWLSGNTDYKSQDCLPWPYSRDKLGYGQIWHEGRIIRAHRLMCIMAHGRPSNPGLQAAHLCGMGHEGCVNPLHLRWKTVAQNAKDRISHYRARQAWSKKLTAEDAAKILAARGNLTQKEIAAEFGVSTQTVNSIHRRLTWRDVGRDCNALLSSGYEIVANSELQQSSKLTHSAITRLVRNMMEAWNEPSEAMVKAVPPHLSHLSELDIRELWRSMMQAAIDEK